MAGTHHIYIKYTVIYLVPFIQNIAKTMEIVADPFFQGELKWVEVKISIVCLINRTVCLGAHWKTVLDRVIPVSNLGDWKSLQVEQRRQRSRLDKKVLQYWSLTGEADVRLIVSLWWRCRRRERCARSFGWTSWSSFSLSFSSLLTFSLSVASFFFVLPSPSLASFFFLQRLGKQQQHTTATKNVVDEDTAAAVATSATGNPISLSSVEVSQQVFLASLSSVLRPATNTVKTLLALTDGAANNGNSDACICTFSKQSHNICFEFVGEVCS